MDLNILNSIATIVVGFTAIIVYKITKHHEKKNAAIIIVMDIRHAEQVVLSILEKGAIDISTKDVLLENNWSKYKHLFASDFSHDDFAVFNRFFDSCVEMSDARKRMREIFYSNLNEKARILQNKILNIKNPEDPESQVLRKKLIDEINTESYVFDPNEPKNRMLQNLQLMGRLSTTVAFEKLKRKAGI